MAIVTPRLNEEPDMKTAREIVGKLKAFVKEHDLPNLQFDLTTAFHKAWKDNFRSDGKNTYLIDPGLFTIQHIVGKPPTIEQLKRIAGKKKK